jgi:hypothetical protein
MKIKNIRASLHRFEVKVPILKKPLANQAVMRCTNIFCRW